MHQSTLPCDFALPAEWEPQSAIMLTWPHAGTDWKPYLPEITDTYLELADIITRYEQLLVATRCARHPIPAQEKALCRTDEPRAALRGRKQ